MPIQADILSSTLRILRDREVDQTFRTIPLLDAVKAKGNVEIIDGGQKVDHPVILSEHSNITQLSSGYESIHCFWWRKASQPRSRSSRQRNPSGRLRRRIFSFSCGFQR